MNEILTNIKKQSILKLTDIALTEFEEYFKKAVKFKDFNFIIVPINNKYNYSSKQYLNLLEYYHTYVEKMNKQFTKVFDNVSAQIEDAIAPVYELFANEKITSKEYVDFLTLQVEWLNEEIEKHQ